VKDIVLTMDIGNSSIKVGIYKGEEMVQYARLSTDLRRTADEYGLQLIEIFRYSDLDIKAVEGAIISSVVPPINYTIEHMCSVFFGVSPITVGPGVKTGMNILYKNPGEVGSDRIMTAIAAYNRYKTACVVIDFGTATTFGAVNARGDFMGGAIMPGMKVALEALVSSTSKLPMVQFEMPETTIARSTIANIQSGIINGYVGAINHIVGKMKAELGTEEVHVVATGGLSRMIADETSVIEDIEPRLALSGLKIVYDLNKHEEPQ